MRVSHWTESSHPVDKIRDTLTGASFQHERRWREALRRLRDGLESGAFATGRVAVAGGNRYATGIP